MMQFTNVKTALLKELEFVIDRARGNLAVTKTWQQNDGKRRTKKIDTTGKLWKSLKLTDVGDDNGVLSVGISMEDYGKFIDKGVSGTQYSTPKPSPYKYKNEGVGIGMQLSIFEWMRAKRIRLRDLQTGKFKKGKITSKSYESLAYVIARSVKRKGINQTFFITKPLEEMEKRLPDVLADAFTRDFEEYLKTRA
jgi:hypothetical protein